MTTRGNKGARLSDADSQNNQIIISDILIRRNELSEDAKAKLMELFGIKDLPIRPGELEFKISGVHTSVINAIRRTCIDEMTGYCLGVENQSALSSDSEFIISEFVLKRLSLIKLKRSINEKVVSGAEWNLYAVNTGSSPRYVYSGELESVGVEPGILFNPTYKIAIINPGKQLTIRGIKIISGLGRNSSIFSVCVHAGYTHLDIPQHEDLDMRTRGGIAAKESGYKISSLLSNPMHHKFSLTVPATSKDLMDTGDIILDACNSINKRLRIVLTNINVESNYILSDLGNEKEIKILLRNETATIAQLIRQRVFNDNSNIGLVVCSEDSSIMGYSVLLKGSGDLMNTVINSINNLLDVFTTIHKKYKTLINNTQ